MKSVKFSPSKRGSMLPKVAFFVVSMLLFHLSLDGQGISPLVTTAEVSSSPTRNVLKTGNEWLLKKDTSAAKQHYLNTLKHAEKRNDTLLQIEVLIQLTNIYPIHELPHVVDLLHATLEWKGDRYTPEKRAAIYHTLGVMYWQKNRTDLAYLPLQQSISIRDSLGDDQGKLSSFLILAQFPVDEGVNLKEKKQLYEQAVEGGYENQAVVAVALVQEAYVKLGRMDSAYVYLKLYHQWKDQLTFRSDKKKITDLQAQHDRSIKRMIEQQQAREKAQIDYRVKMRSNELLYYLLLLGSCVLFILLFTVLKIKVGEWILKGVFWGGSILLLVLLAKLIHPFIESIAMGEIWIERLINIIFVLAIFPWYIKGDRWLSKQRIKVNR